MIELTNVVSEQPSKFSTLEEYIIDLDALQVVTWSPQDVVNNFVEKLDCGYAAELFLANKINGRSLMSLTEEHLKEIGINMIGDRVCMMQLIGILKKKKKELETNASLWSGETPAEGCEYSNGCLHCCLRYLCPCCSSRTYWKVTGQGVFFRKVPPCGGNCGTISTEYMDYRFFKDLELKEEYLCCCCSRRYNLQLYVNEASHDASDKESDALFPAPRQLLHPEGPKIEKIIRNAWNAARLVSE